MRPTSRPRRAHGPGRLSLAAAGALVVAVGLTGCGATSTTDASADDSGRPAAPAVHYASATSGTLSISEGWVSTAGMSGMRMRGSGSGELAAYAVIRNRGGIGDKLVSVSSPVAGRVELHSTTESGSAATMTTVAGVAVPAGATTRFQLGGLHVMLEDLHSRPQEGNRIDLSWTFASGTVVHASFPVLGPEDRPGL